MSLQTKNILQQNESTIELSVYILLKIVLWVFY